MIEPDHSRRTIRRQSELVGISRSTFYHGSTATETPPNPLLLFLIESASEDGNISDIPYSHKKYASEDQIIIFKKL